DLVGDVGRHRVGGELVVRRSDHRTDRRVGRAEHGVEVVDRAGLAAAVTRPGRAGGMQCHAANYGLARAAAESLRAILAYRPVRAFGRRSPTATTTKLFKLTSPRSYAQVTRTIRCAIVRSAIAPVRSASE